MGCDETETGCEWPKDNIIRKVDGGNEGKSLVSGEVRVMQNML